MDGPLHARLHLDADGNSLRQFASTVDGTITAVLPHGAMRSSLAELTGVNLRGIGLALQESIRARQVRCAVASFEGTDGLFKAQQLLIDTDNVLIEGSGEHRSARRIARSRISGLTEKDAAGKGQITAARAGAAAKSVVQPRQESSSGANRGSCVARCRADSDGGSPGARGPRAGARPELRGAQWDLRRGSLAAPSKWHYEMLPTTGMRFIADASTTIVAIASSAVRSHLAISIKRISCVG